MGAGEGRGENRDQPPQVDVCLSAGRENGQERFGEMKLVVTGSNGFIGQNTCRRLIDLGHQVIGVDDLSEGSSRRPVNGVRYHVRCVTDTEWLRRLFREIRPSAVIHLAAVPRVSYSVQEPLRSATPNLTGTISVLNAMLKAGLVGESRLVFASSSSVYGGADTLPTPETHPCNPQSPYALTKLQGEQWCRMFHRLYGLDVVSLRYFNVFGPGARFGGAYSTVLPAWLHHLYVDPSYQPYLEGDGTQTRDFCFVDNVVQANVAAAVRNHGFSAEVLNIGQGQAHSLIQLQQALEQISGRKLPLERRPPRTADVAHTQADISQARAELEFNPTIDFRDELSRTAAWYRERRPAPAGNA